MKNEDLFEAIIQEGVDAGTVPANETAAKLEDMLTAINARLDAKFNELNAKITEITNKEGVTNNEQSNITRTDMHGDRKEENDERYEDRQIPSGGGQNQQG